MYLPRLTSIPARLASRGLPRHLSTLVLLLQRSPLVKLLPEARVLSTSGFSEALSFTVTAIAGLGAFNAVSGATIVAQTVPSAGSNVVNLVGGTAGVFQWQVTGFTGSLTASTWTISSGRFPQGFVHGDLEQSRNSFASGVPVELGSFPVSITLWEDPTASGGRSVTGDFTINVTAPPAPGISVQPQGGNFTEGAFVSLIATQTFGFSFIWSKDGEPLTPDSTVLAGTATPRRYRVPTADPGTTWRTGVAFNDSTWTAVNGGIGYDTNPNPVNYAASIAPGGNVQSLMSGTGRTAVHIRIPFTMTGSTPVSNLKLRVQCDDGFVAWLNGTEIANQNPLPTIAWNSPSGNQAVDANAVQFRDVDVSRSIASLRTGENLLAVQAMNYDPGSSDLLFNCELIGHTEGTTHTRRLIIPAINANQAGSYTLTITNPTDSVTSDPAVVVLPPQIEAHPADITIASGQTTTLSVEAIISPPWTYQWFQGPAGDTSQPVAGATSLSFTTPALTQTTSYWVRVTNSAGSVNSNAATVTVMPEGEPPVISNGPQSVAVDAGSSANLSVTATGAGPLSYQWYTGVSGDTTGLIANATASTFATPALTASASYWVRVTNASGSVDSSTATVSIREPFQTWRQSQFTSAELDDPSFTGPAADPDGDGITNEQEYIFGTGPKFSQPGLTPSLSSDGQNVVLTFVAAAATGPGYVGRTRHYSIEVTGNLASGPWTVIPAFSDVIAANQEVSWNMSIGQNPKFCRLRVWLTP